jgi:hypothetical protein
VRPGHWRLPRRRALAATTAAATALLLAGAEIAVRHAIEGRISAAARSALHSEVSVGIGATPALIDALRGSISTVTINDQDFRTCSLQDVDVDLALHDVTSSGHQVQADSSDALIAITGTAMSSLLAEKAPQLGQVSATPDPADNAIAISLGPGGTLSIHERPALHGEALTLSPVTATIGGQPVPPSLMQRITARASFSYALPQLPIGLKANGVHVSQDGITLTAAGKTTTLDARARTIASSGGCGRQTGD